MMLAAAVAVAGAAAQAAESMAPAIDRPAVLAMQPERAMMIAAATAGRRIIAVGERGVILYSDDAGRHWKQAASPVSVTLTAVRFDGDRKGIAVGHGAVVLATDDGGQTWSRRLDGRRLAELLLADARKRNDAASLQSAERFSAEGADKPLLDVLMMGGDRVIVIGAYGLALASEDGAKTWSSWAGRLDNPKGLHLYAVRQRDQRVVMAGEQGLALKSEDGGRTFQRMGLPYQGSWFTVELPNHDEIVLAGLRGNVWRSVDMGTSWVQQPLPLPATLTGSVVKPDGTLLLASQGGFVFARRGAQYVPLNSAPLPMLNGLVVAPDGGLFALSSQGVLLVKDKP